MIWDFIGMHLYVHKMVSRKNEIIDFINFTFIADIDCAVA